MDPTELWLAENDPEYATVKRASFPHLRDGHYQPPRQEMTWGDAEEVTEYVHDVVGGTRYADGWGWRNCERCLTLFWPTRSWHRFCGAQCRGRNHDRNRRRLRAAYMRHYRLNRKLGLAA